MLQLCVIVSLILASTVHAAPGVNGGGIKTTMSTEVLPIPDAEFSSFVASPMCTNLPGGGSHIINTTVSGGADKLSFTFGTISANSEVAFIDELGDMSIAGVLTASNFTGSSSGTNTGNQTITLTSDVTGTGTGTFATTIANNAITSAKILDGTIVGSDLASNISISTSGTLGATNLSGTNTGDQTITLTSDVTGSGTSSFATTIATGAVTSAKILDGTIAGGDLATNITINTTSSVTAASFKLTQVTSLPTCDVNSVGTMLLYRKNGADHTSICACERTGIIPAYAWNAFSTLGDCA